MVTPYGPAVSRARSVLAVGSVSAFGMLVALQIGLGFSADAATTSTDPSTTVPVLWENGTFSPPVLTLPAGDTLVVDNEDGDPITLSRTVAPVFSVTILPTTSQPLPFPSDVGPGDYKVQLDEGGDTPTTDTTLAVTIPAAQASPTDSPSATPSPSDSPTSDAPTGSPAASGDAGSTPSVGPADSATPAASPTSTPTVATTPAAAPNGMTASEAPSATGPPTPPVAARASGALSDVSLAPSASPSVLTPGVGIAVPRLSLLDGELAPEAPLVAVAAPLVAGAPVTAESTIASTPIRHTTYGRAPTRLVAANQVVDVRRLGLPAGLAFVLLAGLSVTIVRVAASRRLIDSATTRSRSFI